jgi:hypothetical protein
VSSVSVNSTATSTTLYSEASAITFAQAPVSSPGIDGVLHSHITCFNFQLTGYYASTCPRPTSTISPGTTLLQYVLAQTAVDDINPRSILLDSQLIISVFMNARMLSNNHPSPQTLRALTNGGHQESNMVGDFPVLGEV